LRQGWSGTAWLLQSCLALADGFAGDFILARGWGQEDSKSGCVALGVVTGAGRGRLAGGKKDNAEALRARSGVEKKTGERDDSPQSAQSTRSSEGEEKILRAVTSCGHEAQQCCARTSKHEEPARCRRYQSRLLDAVVGGFAGDDDVVDVGFAEAGAGDADEAAVGFEIVERGGADVAHAGFEAANELFGQSAERTLIRDAAFDAFGDGLAALAVGVVLYGGVTVGAGVHRSGGAHAAVGLEGAALIENCFAGGFFSAGEKAADHHAGSACGDGFRNVT